MRLAWLFLFYSYFISAVYCFWTNEKGKEHNAIALSIEPFTSTSHVLRSAHPPLIVYSLMLEISPALTRLTESRTFSRSWYFMIRWMGLISMSGICRRCPSFSRNSCDKTANGKNVSLPPRWRNGQSVGLAINRSWVQIPLGAKLHNTLGQVVHVVPGLGRY